MTSILLFFCFVILYFNTRKVQAEMNATFLEEWFHPKVRIWNLLVP
jgi:hypothetical protein